MCVCSGTTLSATRRGAGVPCPARIPRESCISGYGRRTSAARRRPRDRRRWSCRNGAPALEMSSLLDVRRYPDVLRAFRWEALWELFDGDRARLNLAHECVDRHAGLGPALRIKFDDGRSETHSFQDLAAWSSRFAHLIARRGVERGDRVAVMLDPSLAFYGAVFGAVKRGAIAVPLFTLFGPDGVAARVEDCRPKLLLVERDAPRWRAIFPELDVLSVDDVATRLGDESDRYTPDTSANDLAVFQYTSGTTRARPAAIRHTHRSVVTLMVGALYGVGLERGDRYLCPSSPAWGHGLWHGTIAPLALGIPVGSYSGKFQGARGRSAEGVRDHQPRGGADCLPDAAAGRARRRRRALTPQGVVHRRADGRGHVRVARANARLPAVQHVRQHRGRRGRRELSRFRGPRGAPRRARQAGARMGGCRRG